MVFFTKIFSRQFQTATWVKNKRPEAADVVHQFMSLGGNWMPMDGECRGCSGDYDL